jgi:hypothetical protein
MSSRPRLSEKLRRLTQEATGRTVPRDDQREYEEQIRAAGLPAILGPFIPPCAHEPGPGTAHQGCDL